MEASRDPLTHSRLRRSYEDKRDMDVNNYTLEMRIKYCKDLRLLAEQIEEIKQGIIGKHAALAAFAPNHRHWGKRVAISPLFRPRSDR